MINLNLDSALNSIIIDDKKGNNHVPDPLQFSYFIANKESIFKEIQTDINSGKYKVENLLLIDVPKPNFTIRPMARPQIRDWVTYQALIDMLIPQIVTKTSDRAYSSRRFSRRKGGIGPWKEFDQKSREYYNSGFKYVVVTDISGYFENINLDELRNKLINYIKDDDRNLIKVIDTLYNQFLVPWSSGRIKNFGLPQGPTASSFLGDVYLDNFDCELEEEPGYLRYVDDIRIFARSEVDAKIALMKIIRALRKYKLSINAKKTKILYDTEISSTIFDHKKPILDAISNAFETKHESKVLAITPILVDDIFSNSFSEDEFSKRHLEFSLFRLIILKSSGIPFDEEVVLGKIFDNFVKKPGQANYFCSFLSLYVEDRRDDSNGRSYGRHYRRQGQSGSATARNTASRGAGTSRTPVGHHFKIRARA